jgi:hypothetical protein
VEVQEVRPDKGSTEPTDEFSFFYGNANVYHYLGTGFSVHKGTISAVKRAVCVRG